MNKQEIAERLTNNYSGFTNYMNGLSDSDFHYANGRSWSAEQQLAHIALCVAPLVHVFGMEKIAITQAFGTTERGSRTYEQLLTDYLAKLQAGGKAPDRFVPNNNPQDRTVLCEELNKLINTLTTRVNTFTEPELDTLCIPHPLLGCLTLREMLYNAIYHVTHHWQIAVSNLKNRATADM